MYINKSGVLFLLTQLISMADKEDEKIQNLLLATKAEVEHSMLSDDSVHIMDFVLRLLRGML